MVFCITVFCGSTFVSPVYGTPNNLQASGIPKEKAQYFILSLKKEFSGDYSRSKIDKVEKINQKLRGLAQFYRHADYTAIIDNQI